MREYTLIDVLPIALALGNETNVVFDLVSRTENNGVPGGYSKLLVESTEDLWLTIKPPKEQSLEKPAEKPPTPAGP